MDKEGRITYCEYAGGRVVRVEKDGTRTVMASEFEGKRFNNPDDLVYKSDGALYWTDLPPRGTKPRPNFVPFAGVYRIKNGKLDLLSKDYRPNGIAFSPDEKYLYITRLAEKARALRRPALTGRWQTATSSSTWIRSAPRQSGRPEDRQRRQRLHGRSGGIVGLLASRQAYRLVARARGDQLIRQLHVWRRRRKDDVYDDARGSVQRGVQDLPAVAARMLMLAGHADGRQPERRVQSDTGRWGSPLILLRMLTPRPARRRRRRG